jgi:hypothetical protein
MRITTLILTCLLLLACASRDEVLRVASPDGEVDAVVVEVNGGATTSFGYQVTLQPRAGLFRRGQDVAWLYGAVRKEDAYGVNLAWTRPGRLTLQYLRARTQKLGEDRVALAGKDIEIRLEPGVTDPTAPRGGMLYNLELARQGQ